VNNAEINNWQAVRSEVLSRIQNRQWKPGDLIPNEADLALEFGCARATVNRALQALAENGLLDRRRKAGTRVALHPVRKATLHIPIIRHEIEDRKQAYSYALISSKLDKPPPDIRAQMGLRATVKCLQLLALHLADSRPYAYEYRWLNVEAVPAASKVDFEIHNANEWLVMNAPFTAGDITLSAKQANAPEAKMLGTTIGQALFVMDRNTRNVDVAITSVKLTFAPGYQLQTTI
jgi:GntR family histidine utilization transcriptional repressor